MRLVGEAREGFRLVVAVGAGSGWWCSTECIREGNDWYGLVWISVGTGMVWVARYDTLPCKCIVQSFPAKSACTRKLQR